MRRICMKVTHFLYLYSFIKCHEKNLNYHSEKREDNLQCNVKLMPSWNYLRRSSKRTWAIQFFRVIVSRTSRNKLARIHPPRETSHWSATRNRPIYELELQEAGNRYGISLKSHRSLHDCSVLHEAVPPTGQNATTFSLIWHKTSSRRIEEPGSLSLSLFLFLKTMLDITVGIPQLSCLPRRQLERFRETKRRYRKRDRAKVKRPFLVLMF